MQQHAIIWVMVVGALNVPHAARADCGLPPGGDVRCTPEHCVFVHGEGPPTLVRESDGLEVTPVPVPDTPVMRVEGLIPTGTYRDQDRTLYTVAEQLPMLGKATITGAFVGSAGMCRDTGPTLPRIEQEDTYQVTLTLARKPAEGAFFHAWYLEKGEPVPSSSPTIADVPVPRPRFAFMPLWASGATWQNSRVTLWVGNPGGADRVAVQLMEPSGQRTTVLTTALDSVDDVAKPYVYCGCAQVPRRPAWWPAGMLVASWSVVVVRRRRRS